MLAHDGTSELVPVAVNPNRTLAVARKNTPWLFFGLLAGGALVAALCRSGLAWDGSYILFKALDNQAPFIDHGRWFTVPLQLPALLISKITSDTVIIGAVFSFFYALVPLLALGLSWFVVRRHNPGLFFWAVLGIGLVSLPGQFFLVSDALMVIQLSWPFLLAIMLGLPKETVGLTVALAVILFLGHPLIIPLFMLGALLALGRGWFLSSERLYMWIWALGLGALAVFSTLRFYIRSDNYESEQLSATVLGNQFSRAVAGNPLWAVVSVLLVATLFFAATLLNRRYAGVSLDGTDFLKIVGLLGLVLAGGLLLWQAADPHLWDGSLDYRLWALLFMLPLFVFATVESWFFSWQSTYSRRLPLILCAGLIFLVVFSVQSISWLNISNQLRTTLAQSSQSCVPSSRLAWTAQTPLGHWSATAYSLLQSDRQPAKVVLPDAACNPAVLEKSLPLTAWDNRAWNSSGWFDLQKLNLKSAPANSSAPVTNPAAPSAPVAVCNFALISGWYEQEQNGNDWWRWSDGNGKLRVSTPSDLSVMLTGNLRSQTAPNTVQVLLNGLPVGKLLASDTNLQKFNPLRLNLKQGNNELIFVSEKPAIQPENDSRRLALLVGNLQFADDAGKSVCELRPQ